MFKNDQIKATIIADSVNSYTGTRITTYELEYPRFIHSEVMTHKMLAKNAASSRAIPVQSMIDKIQNDPAHPVFWGKNQAGMQSKEELVGDNLDRVQYAWKNASTIACIFAKYMSEEQAHKQIVNRVLEPFSMMKTVITGTEWNNFFWLRNHTDAQPEFHALADLMQKAKDQSKPFMLYENEWHLPYIECERYKYSSDFGDPISDGEIIYSSNGQTLTTEEALVLSASLCAQTSYRKSDDSLEKAKDIYSRLVESEPVHASPFEHQGMCYNINPFKLLTAIILNRFIPKGVTHIDINRNWWSGNLKHFIQYRQLIPNNVKVG